MKTLAIGPYPLQWRRIFIVPLSAWCRPENNPGVAYFNLKNTDFTPTEGATLLVGHGLIEVKAWKMQEHPVVIPLRVPPGTSMVVMPLNLENL